MLQKKFGGVTLQVNFGLGLHLSHRGMKEPSGEFVVS